MYEGPIDFTVPLQQCSLPNAGGCFFTHPGVQSIICKYYSEKNKQLGSIYRWSRELRKKRHCRIGSGSWFFVFPDYTVYKCNTCFWISTAFFNLFYAYIDFTTFLQKTECMMDHLETFIYKLVDGTDFLSRTSFTFVVDWAFTGVRYTCTKILSCIFHSLEQYFVVNGSFSPGLVVNVQIFKITSTHS